MSCEEVCTSLLSVCFASLNIITPFCPTKNSHFLCKLLEQAVQKKSRLRGSEPEEDFAVYIVFEEGLVMCINNPVSAKFSSNLKLTMKGIALLQYNFSRHAQCRVQEVWLFLTF